MDFVWPSAQGRADTTTMSQALQASMQYIAEVIDLDQPAILQAESFVPGWRTHGLYHGCIRAIEADRLDLARTMFRRSIDAASTEKRPPSIDVLTEGQHREEMDLIRGELALHADRIIGIGFASPTILESRAEIDKVGRAVEILRTVAPEFHDEFMALADQILLVGEDDGVHVRSASSFNLFGLIMFWADPIHSPIYYMQHIAHEVGHMRLFLANIEDELVLNPPEQTFTAPFRDDRRPMMGIFHAAFVLARMALVLRRAKNNLSDFTGLTDLDEKLVQCETRFRTTAAEVRLHGILTERGRDIFEGCVRAVDGRQH